MEQWRGRHDAPRGSTRHADVPDVPRRAAEAGALASASRACRVVGIGLRQGYPALRPPASTAHGEISIRLRIGEKLEVGIQVGGRGPELADRVRLIVAGAARARVEVCALASTACALLRHAVIWVRAPARLPRATPAMRSHPKLRGRRSVVPAARAARCRRHGAAPARGLPPHAIQSPRGLRFAPDRKRAAPQGAGRSRLHRTAALTRIACSGLWRS